MSLIWTEWVQMGMNGDGVVFLDERWSTEEEKKQQQLVGR